MRENALILRKNGGVRIVSSPTSVGEVNKGGFKYDHPTLTNTKAFCGKTPYLTDWACGKVRENIGVVRVGPCELADLKIQHGIKAKALSLRDSDCRGRWKRMSIELDEVAFDAGLIGPGGVVAKSVENVVLKVHDEEEDGVHGVDETMVRNEKFGQDNEQHSDPFDLALIIKAILRERKESKIANTRNMILDGVFIKKYPPIKLPKDSTSNCCHECIRLEASHIFLLAIL
ncbi:unnamed protein product [Malus baccata var. baccata]